MKSAFTPALLICIAAATATPARAAAGFVSGAVECRLVDDHANVSTFTFDYAADAVTVANGEPFVRNGTRMTNKAGETGMMGVRVRQSEFKGFNGGTETSFQFVEVQGTDYEANRLTVLTQSGPVTATGSGVAMSVSRLKAIGMCVRAPAKQRS
ncbi:MAG TPA: hypothetical protein VGC56_17010 [Allosphingosinicella sp.]|jgi:hypothetical protein